MKNSDIHQNLEQKEVRDFLSFQLSMTWNKIEQEEMPSPNSMDTLDWAILSAKRARDLAAKQVEQAEQRKAIVILIDKMGWKEFDVSEMTIKCGIFWFSFIGTEEEYRQQFKIT